MLQETDQPLLADRIEEASEVRVKNIVHLCAVDSGDECIQRIVLAALGPEPVREAEEVFLVDRIQHRACRLLDDLVFECGNCERALLTISSGLAPPTPCRSPGALRVLHAQPRSSVSKRYPVCRNTRAANVGRSEGRRSARLDKS